jgi:hypothetical protein
VIVKGCENTYSKTRYILILGKAISGGVYQFRQFWQMIPYERDSTRTARVYFWRKSLLQLTLLLRLSRKDENLAQNAVSWRVYDGL